jgi:hypothetical protein
MLCASWRVIEPVSQEPKTEGRGVAVLLTSAAVVAAGLAGWSSFLSGQAADRFDAAMREQLDRAARDVLAQKTVYIDEAPDAMKATVARVRAEAYSSVADKRPSQASTLLARARAERRTVAQLTANRTDLSAGRYRTPQGGFDVAARLRDLRGGSRPNARDPSTDRRDGDELMHRASLVAAAGVPTAIAFLLGTLAAAFPRRRRRLLGFGTATLAAAVATALLVGIE